MSEKKKRKRTNQSTKKFKEPPTKADEPIQIQVDAVAFGGDGIARHDGKVIFIPDALPGEVLLIQLESSHARFAKAKIVKRLRFADYVLRSPCPYATRCGGCQWLQVPYERQLAWKKSFIEAALTRIAKIEVPIDWMIYGSQSKQGYRNRIKIKLQHRADGSFMTAYYAKASHDLVPIQSCWIAHEAINQVLEGIGRLSLPRRDKGALYELELQHWPAHGNRVTAAFLPETDQNYVKNLQEASDKDPALRDRLVWTQLESEILEKRDGLRYRSFPGQFQQVNLEGNQQLRAWIQDKAKALKARSVVDLFCGSGNLSLQLAKSGLWIWGLEVGAKAIACAQQNIAENDIKTAQYACGMAHDLHHIFPELHQKTIDLVLIDPPRKGMAETISAVLDLKAKNLIYISCDPNTLARDLRALTEAGYHLTDLIGLDFFPHSYHVETAVHLSLTQKDSNHQL